MNLSSQTAKHFKEIFFGGNWTCSNFKEVLKEIDYMQATKKTNGINSIAKITFHTGYYVNVLLNVLQGNGLGNAKDEFSFQTPEINSEEDWQGIIATILNQAEQVIPLIEKLPEEKFYENFEQEKYGNYFRNIHGLIEHTHYHLGQIALLKKLA